MSQEKSRRSRYRTITEVTRKQLIKRVCEDGQSIKDVSEELGLNISTTKAIIKVYEQEGRIGKKKKRNKIINVIETYSFFSMDGMKMEQISPIQIKEQKVSVNKNESLEKVLTQKSDEKAKQLLNQVLETKKKVEQALMQQQFMQTLATMQQQYGYYPCAPYY